MRAQKYRSDLIIWQFQTYKLTSGQLQFDHRYATGTNVDNQFIYLCFNLDSPDDHRKCRKSSDPTGIYEEIPLSIYSHANIRIGSNKGKSEASCSFILFL